MRHNHFDINWVKKEQMNPKSKYGFNGSKKAHIIVFRVLQGNIYKIEAFLGQITILCTILGNWGSI